MLIDGKVRFFTDIANIEKEALDQVYRTASLPFVHGLAVMPDCHYGKGSTVGTVVATTDAVMPACVGVDIGCGMIAARTSLSLEQVAPHLKELRFAIEAAIPSGAGAVGYHPPGAWLNNVHTLHTVRELERRAIANGINPDAHSDRWRASMGTLGGGNHFIEICTSVGLPHWGVAYSEPVAVWIILHSGSRGVGNKIAQHHMGVARSYTPKSYMNGVDLPHPDLSALPIASPEGKAYLREMYWAQEFAEWNRKDMLRRVGEAITQVTGEKNFMPKVQRGHHWYFDCSHNYASGEVHDGRTLLITRKGAVSAKQGQFSLIPGSMGTNSYVVAGRGNVESFSSAPHGAGRRMSRRKARESFTTADLQAHMDALQIESRVRDAIVDEHPGAYKSIGDVMEEAKDLVIPCYRLTQILSVKGD